MRHRNEAPKARWAGPPPADSVEPEASDAGIVPAFRPTDVGPFSPKCFAPGDRQWVKVADPRHPDAPTLLYKTLLHPDIYRSWADLFVVAASLDSTVLHAQAGKGEPKADPGTPAIERTRVNT